MRYLRIGRAVWDRQTRQLARAGRALGLTVLEGKLIDYLADRVGQIVDTTELLTNVWGYAPTTQSRAVESTVSRLRKKLSFDAGQLQTVYGRGYMLLPTVDEELFGRQALIEATSRALSVHRLLNLHGPGGIGKTALARVVSQRWGQGTWVEFREPTSKDDFQMRLLAALGIDVQSNGGLEAALKAHGSILLVLDAAEHLDRWVVSLARDCLRTAHELHILLTSRIHFQDEALVAVPPLDQRPALELLKARLAERNHPDSISDHQATQLVDRVDRIPLAIELIAGRLTTLHPEDLVMHLGRHSEVLDGADRSMTESLNRSWRLIGATEQRCLAAASFLMPGFTIDTLGEVAGLDAVTTIRGLEGLLRASLIRRRGRQYSLLEVIRSFAREQVSAELEKGFLDWVLTQADVVLERLRRGEATSKDDLTQLCFVVFQALERVSTEDARARLWLCVWTHDRQHGNPLRCTSAIASLDLAALTPSSAVHVSYARAWFAFTQHHPQAAELAVEAIECAKSLGEPIDVVRSLLLQCNGSRDFPSEDQLALARRLVAYVESTDVPDSLRGLTFKALGASLVLVGAHEEAIEAGHRALARLADSDPPTALYVRAQIAISYFWLGQRELARDEFERAFEMAEREGLARQIILVGLQLADACTNLGDRERATEVYERVAEVSERHGYQPELLAVRIGLSGLEPTSERARAAYAETRARALALDRPREAAVCSLQLATLHHQDGQLDPAAVAYQDCIELAQSLSWTDVESIARSCRAVLIAERGETARAVAELAKRPAQSTEASTIRAVVEASLHGDWEAVDEQLDRLAQRVATQTRRLVERLRQT